MGGFVFTAYLLTYMVLHVQKCFLIKIIKMLSFKKMYCGFKFIFCYSNIPAVYLGAWLIKDMWFCFLQIFPAFNEILYFTKLQCCRYHKVNSLE